VLHSIGGGVLFEVGAGSGALCCGVLRALESLGVLPERYLVLETSAELRARQQHRVQQEIPALAARVSWIDTPPDQDWRGLLLANEVLDALPVERVILDQDSIRQQGVGVEQGAFCWRDRVAPPPLRDAAQELQAALPQPLPSPYRTEINLQLAPWLDAIAGRLAAGCVLLIDYGGTRGEVYHPERRDGTLICHYRHRAHGDPFLYPGLQDVSAAVDFTAVAGWAATAGMQLYGYTTLAHFLIDSGLDEALRKRAGPDGVPDARSAGQARLLTLPGEMGERFKTMALGRGLPQTPRGFAGSDQRARLFTTR
jgi:SAM-dependent MidA family methyltransferase